MALKQKDSYDDYQNNFQEMAMESEFSEEDLITMFINGLRNKVKFEVQIRAPKTLNKAYTYASTFEDCMSKTKFKDEKINFVKTENKKVFKKNFTKKTNKKCFKCNKEGHYSNECRSQIKCFKCQKVGHKANECRVKKEKVNIVEEEKNKLLMINGKINGKIIKRIIFDIGATTSIMAEKTAKKFGFKINSCESRVKVADDRVIEVLGKSEPLLINIREHVCKISFLILKHDEYDVLLGLDYFNETGLGIYPKQRLLKYPDEDIHLSESEDDYVFYNDQIFTLEELDDEVAKEEFIEWKNDNINLEIKSQIKLSGDLNEKFEKIKPTIVKNFASNYNDLKGGCTIGEFKITLTEDKIIHKQPYRRTDIEQKALKKR
jgi:hypothetical protein